MCVILYSPAGNYIKAEYITNSVTSNPDGIGYAYWEEGGKVSWVKGVFDQVPEHLYKIASRKDVHLAFHARLATHGAVTDELCHPFLCSPYRGRMVKRGYLKEDEYLLFHNGVFSVVSRSAARKSGNESDTSIIARIVRALVHEFGLQDTADVLADMGGKILLVDHEGNVALSGLYEREGLYASNSCYMGYSKYYYYSYVPSTTKGKGKKKKKKKKGRRIGSINELEEYLEEKGYMLVSSTNNYRTDVQVADYDGTPVVFLEYVPGLEGVAIEKVLDAIQ